MCWKFLMLCKQMNNIKDRLLHKQLRTVVKKNFNYLIINIAFDMR